MSKMYFYSGKCVLCQRVCSSWVPGDVPIPDTCRRCSKTTQLTLLNSVAKETLAKKA